jgi:hypothetical protein
VAVRDRETGKVLESAPLVIKELFHEVATKAQSMSKAYAVAF